MQKTPHSLTLWVFWFTWTSPDFPQFKCTFQFKILIFSFYCMKHLTFQFNTCTCSILGCVYSGVMWDVLVSPRMLSQIVCFNLSWTTSAVRQMLNRRIKLYKQMFTGPRKKFRRSRGNWTVRSYLFSLPTSDGDGGFLW